MLCYATPCCAVLRCVVLCGVVLCCVVLCCAIELIKDHVECGMCNSHVRTTSLRYTCNAFVKFVQFAQYLFSRWQCLRRLTHRFTEAMLLEEILHEAHVIDTATQLTLLSCVIDADQECLLPSTTCAREFTISNGGFSLVRDGVRACSKKVLTGGRALCIYCGQTKNGILARLWVYAMCVGDVTLSFVALKLLVSSSTCTASSTSALWDIN